MPDQRTRRQKLEAMARQTASPHEADVARRKLEAMGAESAGAGPETRYRPSDSWAFRDAAATYEYIRRHYSYTWTPPPPSEAEVKRKGAEALAQTLRSKGIYVPYSEGDASMNWAAEAARWNERHKANG